MNIYKGDWFRFCVQLIFPLLPLIINLLTASYRVGMVNSTLLCQLHSLTSQVITPWLQSVFNLLFHNQNFKTLSRFFNLLLLFPSSFSFVFHLALRSSSKEEVPHIIEHGWFSCQQRSYSHARWFDCRQARGNFQFIFLLSITANFDYVLWIVIELFILIRQCEKLWCRQRRC